MRFEGRRVLVAGGSGGIGRAVCIAFAREGARVAVHYGTNADAAAARIASMTGESHIAIAADIADPDQVKGMIDGAATELGGLDVLVNCFGVHLPQPIDGATYEEWQRVWARTLAVNLVGAANTIWCAVRHMKNGGAVVSISSRGSFRGEPAHPAYGASKAALNNLTGSLAVALAPRNIRVAAVAPGFVQTGKEAPSPEQVRSQSPLGRVATPEDVANAVLFLASDEGAFATGSILDLNGASYLRM